MSGKQVDKEKYYQARISILEQLFAQLQDSLAATSVELQEYKSKEVDEDSST